MGGKVGGHGKRSRFSRPYFLMGEGVDSDYCQTSQLFAHFRNYLEAKMTGSICFLPSCAVITFHARDLSQVMTFVIVLLLQSKSIQRLIKITQKVQIKPNF